ncbi:hypothetical protein EN836_21270 [Mesorhizobium sp. M1C.F.Ca.ET.193.01.1.1]|uniref:hypothetical protein n=2 Tax=Mesorhizobium TaxID=68287 RepID=UPI000FD3F8D8|nr:MULTISPECIES: hypothetical protein [unclassified Mesorhizobium]TGS96321.1 hypothetical protein EN820_41470 [bacterium M00.F.Ca.ET.177.01.1.1]TGQ52140.1 hypothetical protein EN853_21260 [Mesorhizobium sp. M1C.F.Ca.ET.210.01.1.1]TGQ68785.1 hypothetical protein EN855_021270 [Mesorhizobium sp. M1C.F.Ca.ET.212.01.1.1]TGR04053.1 hypothetical protein EN847_20745 [Mesorhizobium sp. M1C.F.Ca.ET.204.01.1.1]TGR24718.1 hypothetical protein EN839_20745 [Mesorhizobium sp. M1C.F.Ca.ET.196.01.1.1]
MKRNITGGRVLIALLYRLFSRMTNRSKSRSSQQYTPTIEEVVRMAPKLNEWASMTAHAYGLYAGINQAIGETKDKAAPVVGHADYYRQMAALLCVVRVFATVDRQAKISLQSVHRYFKKPESVAEVAQAYAASPPQGSPNPVQSQKFIDQFNADYARIDWKALGNLQSFRNTAIAHIGWDEVNRFVTFGQLEALLGIVSKLAGQLTVMTSGLNNWPDEHRESARDNAYHKWSAIFAADAADRIDY